MADEATRHNQAAYDQIAGLYAAQQVDRERSFADLRTAFAARLPRVADAAELPFLPELQLRSCRSSSARSLRVRLKRLFFFFPFHAYDHSVLSNSIEEDVQLRRESHAFIVADPDTDDGTGHSGGAHRPSPRGR